MSALFVGLALLAVACVISEVTMSVRDLRAAEEGFKATVRANMRAAGCGVSSSRTYRKNWLGRWVRYDI